MKCKLKFCKSKATRLCILCAKPVCHHHSKGWPEKPVCGKCNWSKPLYTSSPTTPPPHYDPERNDGK